MTILRPGGFASNSFAWTEPIRGRRTVAAPFGDVGLPVVDPADIGECTRAMSPQEACRRLVQLACERGGDDNITTVIARVDEVN